MKHSSNRTLLSTKFVSPRANIPVLRPRLFQRLDRLRSHAILWLAGAPGSGKTTLVSHYLAQNALPHLWYQIDAGDADIASFFLHLRQALEQAAPRSRQILPPLLTPEYLTGLSSFVRLYAEAMADRLKKPALIVLDNYEQVSTDALLHEVIRDLAASLPAEIGLLVLSRNEPPPVFARMRLHGDLAVMRGDELNLTSEEAQAFAKARQIQAAVPFDTERVAQALQQSQGWIAGFMFLLPKQKEDFIDSQAAGANRQVLFDYFTMELFRHFSMAIQRGLVGSALLPAITMAQVAQLSGNPEVGPVLADLHRRNCFVVQRGQGEPVYEFHGLFRAFLLDRAQGLFEPDAWRRLKKRAGDLLAETGQADRAAVLYAEAEAWEALAGLILREAPSLIAAGRNRTLDEWITAIPSAATENPWLLFWQGMAKSPFHSDEARALFERAYFTFDKQDDAAGLYSSWSGLIETYFNEFDDFHPVDPWIEEFKRLRRRHPNYPSPDVELRTACAFNTVFMRKPQDPLVQDWKERAPDLLDPVNRLEQSIVLGTQLIIHAGWQGDFHKIRLVNGRLNAYSDSPMLSPLCYIVWQIFGQGFFHLCLGDLEALRVCVDKAMAMAERTGLHLWDFQFYSSLVQCLLVSGDVIQAEAILDASQDSWPNSSNVYSAFLHLLHSNIAGQRGNWPEAAEQGRTAVTMTVKSGTPFPEAWCRIVWARALFRLGEPEQAWAHLNQAKTIARAMNSRMLENFCLITEADAAFQTGQEPLGLARLAEALALSRTMGGSFYDLGGPAYLAPLYHRALEAGIEIELVQSMIHRYRFPPPDPAMASDRWPWPVRIYTLGRFDILCDGQPLRSTRKAQNKPLELIKLLCAFGGFSVHQNNVTDILWPDAMGDAAEQALNTTLHRLRNLLKNEQAIRLEDRRLSLDPRIVWVDALVFDRIAHLPDRIDKRSLQSALNRYRGHFLEGESAAWALTFRERLRSHFLKLSEHLGILLEQEEDWPAAIDCYYRVIEVEPVAENFYRRLMICHSRLGRRAEALAVFQRCRQALLTHLGVSPTAETQALYRQLSDG